MVATEFHQQRIQIVSTTRLAAASLEVEKSDDHFADIRVERQATARPGIAKVSKIPARGDQPVESVGVAEDCLDGVMRQVVAREKRGLGALLPLPRRGSILSCAAERRVSVGVFLYADCDWPRFLHARYLM